MLSPRPRTISIPTTIRNLEDIITFLFNELSSNEPISKKEISKLIPLIESIIKITPKLPKKNLEITEASQVFTRDTGIKIEPPLEVSLDSTDTNGYTMLTWAAYQGHDEIVNFILRESKPNINAPTKDGSTALSHAAFMGHTQVVRLLKDAKAELNIKDTNGDTALTRAASKGHTEIIALLLPEAKLELKNKKGNTALDEAVENGKPSTIRFLLDCKATIQDPDRLLFFIEGCEQRERDVSTILICLHNQLNRLKSKSSNTALLITRVKNHLRILEDMAKTSLWTSNSNDDGQTIRNAISQRKSGDTAVIWAAREGHEQLVYELASKVAINEMNDSKHTPLEEAMASKKPSIVNILLKHNAAIPNPDTLFNFLINHPQITVDSFIRLRNELNNRLEQKNNSRIETQWKRLRELTIVYIWCLVDTKEDVFKKSKTLNTIISGKPALLLAAQEGFPELASELIKSKANVNVKEEKTHTTPLMHAASRGHYNIAQLLIEAKAEIALTNQKGDTALDIAIENKKLPVVFLLLRHNALIRAPQKLFDLLTSYYEQSNINLTEWNNAFIHLRDELQIRIKKTNTSKEQAHWRMLRDHTIMYILATSQTSLSIQETMETITNARREYNGSLLELPANMGQTNIVRELIAAKAEVNAQSIKGDTALMAAAAGDIGGNEHIDTVRELLAAKANINIQGEYGHTALRWAAHAGHRNVAELLIQAGEKLELPDVENNTALDHAIQNKKISTVSLLLDHKASIQHPKKLFDFLQDCDQKDPNVLSSFNHLLNNLNYRLTHDTDIEPELKTTRDLTVAYIWAAQQPSYPPIIKIIKNTMNETVNFPRVLVHAASLGHEHKEVAKELMMKANASINLPDKDGGTALIHAARLGYEDITSILLQANADPNFYQKGSFYSSPPLLVAANWGNTGVVSLLMENPRTQVDVELPNGDIALTIAASHGHTDVIHVLLTKENVNKQSKADGYTALMCAAREGQEETAHILIEAKAALELVNQGKETALDIAIKYKKLGMVLLLLGQKALIRDPEKLFDFLQSCAPKEPMIVLKILTYLDQQWNTRLTTIEDAELLHKIQHSLQILRALSVTSLCTTNLYGTKTKQMIQDALNYGQADFIVRLIYNDTALAWAISINDAKLVGELLEKTEAKPNDIAIGLDGHTPLTHAARKGHLNIIKVLIEKKVNLDAKNDVGNTALIEATDQSHVQVVSELLEAKANPNILGQHGTALTSAAYKGYTNIVILLIAKKADLDAKNALGYTPLMLAAAHGHEQTVYHLLENKAKLNPVNENGKTALDLALGSKQLSTITLLLGHHASITEPIKLFDFLKSCEQRDPRVLASLHHLQEQCSARLIEISEEKTERKSTNIRAELLSKVKHHIQILQDLAATPLWARFEDECADNRIKEKYNKESIEKALTYGTRGHTALTWAVSSPPDWNWHGGDNLRKQIIITLLEKAQVNPNTPGENGETALDIAIKNGRLCTVNLLLDHKASIQNPEKLFNFLKKSYDNNENESDFNSESRDKKYEPAFEHLYHALNTHLTAPNIPKEKLSRLRKLKDTTVIYIWHTNHRDEDITDLLNAIDVDEKKYGDTALMSAIRMGHNDIATQLVEAKTALDPINNEGELALDIAIKKNNFLIVSALLKQKSPIRDPQKLFDFLTSCYQQKNIDLIKLKNAFTQLRNELNAHLTNEQLANKAQLKTLRILRIQTITYEWGAGEDDKKTIDRNDKRNLLYSRKPSDAAPDRQAIIHNLLYTRKHGDTTLICAARVGCTALVHELLLVVNTAFINTRGEGGYTALMRAARNGHADIVKQLIRAGANLNLVNGKEQTALEEAIEDKRLSIVTILLGTPGIIINYPKTFNFLRSCVPHHKTAVAKSLSQLCNHLAAYIEKTQAEGKYSENYERFLNKMQAYLHRLTSVSQNATHLHATFKPKHEPKPELGSSSAPSTNARPGGF